jgi:hypothetical protein
LTFTPRAPSGDEDAADHALVHGLELHGGLVGLDLGHHVAGLDRLPFLDEPAARVPSSMVGDRAGIRICVGIRGPLGGGRRGKGGRLEAVLEQMARIW